MFSDDFMLALWPAHPATKRRAMNRNTQTTVQSGFNPLQLIKLVVYSLLLINWAFYIADDWRIAQYTLREGDDFLTLTAAFATSIGPYPSPMLAPQCISA